MGDLKAGGESCIRIAVEDDIPHLARHHRMMFEEIREQSGTPVDPSVLAVLEKEYGEKLTREFRSGTCIAWVADIGNRIVSSGAISIVSYVPVPHDPSCRIAFLHSVYKEKAFRHQHHAHTITGQAADYWAEPGYRTHVPFCQRCRVAIVRKERFCLCPESDDASPAIKMKNGVSASFYPPSAHFPSGSALL